ncbi:ATR-interacting protein isoform X2 [Lingula anatina]|uniref:ATR-interacting protein isoform X2 n=1 Tax=Lingula anatina TaxID=7574 RepID=A0A1S3I801_LINAN|nr:ATR-interacting protein isoform X2 [Lingula anatina]|eukprot:XP_013394395.1 ATR-interacting protein isoform X2 [Lingula anatina]
MAANPLFSGIGQRRSFSYHQARIPLAAKSNNSAVLTAMSVGKGDDDPPPDKRRKVADGTSGNLDQLWGEEEDDFCLTQDQLDDLELLASQQPPTQVQKPSHDTRATQPSSVPQASYQSSLPAQPTASLRQTNVRGGSQIGKGSVVSMSGHSSKHSTHYHPVQSNITLPIEDLSPTQPWTADRSGKEMPTLGPSSGKTSPSLPGHDGKRFGDVLQKQNASLKEELGALKLELNKAKEEQYGKDGQIQILRNNLNQKEAELSKLRQEKLHLVEKHTQEKSEKERLLQKDVEKLSSQLQFKEREIQEVQTVCRNLEQRLKGLQNTVESPRPVVTSSVSPGPSKKPKTEDSPPGSVFPTSQTFHSPPPSQRLKGNIGAPAVQAATGTMKAEDRSTMTGPERCGRTRRMKLKVDVSRGCASGSMVLSKLMVGDSQSTESIVGLLNIPPAATAVNTKQDGGSLWSPVQTKKSSKVPSCPEPERVVSSGHYSLAVQAVRDLLQSHVDQPQISHRGGEALLLPIIEDYLMCYINMRQGTTVGTSSSSHSSRSGSLDNLSIDSLSSSMRGFSLAGESLPGTIKRLALSSLRILHKLVCYSERVRQELIQTKNEPKGVDVVAAPLNTVLETIPKKEASNGGSSTSGNISTGPSSGNRSSSTLSSSLSLNGGQHVHFSDSHLLGRVIQLANPAQNSQVNEPIVESSLNVLIALSRHSEPRQLNRLLPVLSKGILFNCLSPDNKPGLNVMSRALELLRLLVSCRQFVTAHSLYNPDSCVLAAVYNLGGQPLEDLTVTDRTALRTKIIELLCAIASSHPNGTGLLVEAKCPCSVEVVRTVVLMMHSELEVFTNTQRGQSVPSLLRSGVSLLHALASSDRLFEEHRKEVGHQYLELLSSLSLIFKDHVGIPETEVNALKDLLHEEESEEDD